MTAESFVDTNVVLYTIGKYSHCDKVLEAP